MSSLWGFDCQQPLRDASDRRARRLSRAIVNDVYIPEIAGPILRRVLAA